MTDNKFPGDEERLRDQCIEYDNEYGTVTVIQDPENIDAWVQSTTTVAIER